MLFILIVLIVVVLFKEKVLRHLSTICEIHTILHLLVDFEVFNDPRHLTRSPHWGTNLSGRNFVWGVLLLLLDAGGTHNIDIAFLRIEDPISLIPARTQWSVSHFMVVILSGRRQGIVILLIHLELRNDGLLLLFNSICLIPFYLAIMRFRLGLVKENHVSVI